MKTVTFTFDELHAFREHYTWVILENDVPVDKPLQSFIDKVLYDSNIKDIEDNSPYKSIPKRY
tara:strand:+ start:69 stop:257 length:189 start_codon:yes stop_codon:yes gene_type:complete